MNDQDLATLQELIQAAVSNTETINKVWIAGAAIVVSLIATMVSTAVQLWVSRVTRKAQITILQEQLAAQEQWSRRVAAGAIAQRRQAWIDGLREDMATFLAQWRELHVDISVYNDTYFSDKPLTPNQVLERMEKGDALASKHRDGFQRMKELSYRILLRLNPSERMHCELQSAMEKLNNEAGSLFFDEEKPDAHRAAASAYWNLVDDVFVKSRAILKEEWDRSSLETLHPPPHAPQK